MSRPAFSVSARVAALAGAALLALSIAGCNPDAGGGVNAKAMRPLSAETVALIQSKGMTKESPIVVQIFKETSEVDVWKATTDGTYALLKTYPICRWSGELGPKVKMGDRQAPEGFYTITRGQMNPNSNYYLSFNLGFPNAYDAAWGRTGEYLMVHGDCSSAGCYAMTDEQIGEIFALARDSFAGGQRDFQVQAYPFRMTAENMARHRTNPNMPFWRMLKEGYDTFEVTRQVPKVDVCDKRYVFNAAPTTPGGVFNPRAACPAYEVPPAIASALDAKRRSDDIRIAALSSSTPVAPIRTGADGGMHPVFLAAFQKPEARDGRFQTASVKAPGTIPATTRPPVVPGQDAPVLMSADAAAATAPSVAPVAEPVVATAGAPVPLARPTEAPAGVRNETTLLATGTVAPAPAAPTRVASVGSTDTNMFSGMSKWLGLTKDEPATTGSAPAPQAAAPAASSGFSLGKLFGQEPAPAPAPVMTAPPAAAVEAPLPPQKPQAQVQPPANRTVAVTPAPVRTTPVAAAPKPAAPRATTVASSKPKPAPEEVAPLYGTPLINGTPNIMAPGTFSGSVQ